MAFSKLQFHTLVPGSVQLLWSSEECWKCLHKAAKSGLFEQAVLGVQYAWSNKQRMTDDIIEAIKTASEIIVRAGHTATAPGDLKSERSDRVMMGNLNTLCDARLTLLLPAAIDLAGMEVWLSWSKLCDVLKTAKS
jgi:hypothetical protein